MRVLVSVASKHGATAEIGELIAGALRDGGLDVTASPPDEVSDLDDLDAAILGSAIYAGRWLEPARSFVERHEAALTAMPVWLFSSGPIGDPPMPAGDPPEGIALAERIGAREHRTFAGRLVRDQLGFVERTVSAVLRAPEGDFRDLEAVRTWADGIVDSISGVPALATSSERRR